MLVVRPAPAADYSYARVACAILYLHGDLRSTSCFEKIATLIVARHLVLHHRLSTVSKVTIHGKIVVATMGAL